MSNTKPAAGVKLSTEPPALSSELLLAQILHGWTQAPQPLMGSGKDPRLEQGQGEAGGAAPPLRYLGPSASHTLKPVYRTCPWQDVTTGRARLLFAAVNNN